MLQREQIKHCLMVFFYPANSDAQVCTIEYFDPGKALIQASGLGTVEIGRGTADAISGRRCCNPAYSTTRESGGKSVRGVADALDSSHKATLARAVVKVELSRAATALLHSQAAPTPGDLTRAGTARAATNGCRGRGGDGSGGDGAI